MDATTTSTVIDAGSGFVTALLGALGAWWRWGRGGSRRCERVCGSMVEICSAMLAAQKAIGSDDPRMVPHFIRIETKLEEVRIFLAGGEAS